MAKNDAILMDGIIDDRVEQCIPSNKRDECFEFLALEQILKDEDLSFEEIMSGLVDGRQDGGIDGFYIFINGHLIDDLKDFIWPKSSVELKLVLVTCKHHETFKQATLDALIATITEFFDFTIFNDELSGAYNKHLLDMREKFITCYRKVSPKLNSFSIEICYASRGNICEIGEEVLLRSKQIEKILERNFSVANIIFKFLGANELINLYRKVKNYTLELPFKDILSSGERYVILTKLSDYYRFITENNILKKYIFDANVRAFMGLNSVNEDIRETLETENEDFWLLNNGVTILVTSASIIGKSLQADDVQIVNGLQTSHSIYNYFSTKDPDNLQDERSVLVKVIVTQDEKLRDSIIKATNNQTMVESTSLHATDKIQRDIEDILLQSGLYYERRKNFYLNQGVSVHELVTLQYLACAYVALILKSPTKAVSLRPKTIRDEEKYKLIFNEQVNIKVWVSLALIFKKIDKYLNLHRPKNTTSEKFLKKWRYIIGLLLLAKHYGKFDFNINEVIAYDISNITEKIIIELINDVKNNIASNSLPVSNNNLFNIINNFESNYNVINKQAVLNSNPYKEANYSISPGKNKTRNNQDFLKKVKEHLPPQPWPPFMERELVQKIGCTTKEYFDAVNLLIQRGEFYRQKNGVLYDKNGKVVGYDENRVDKNTLKLKENPL
ncbi:AIPR protein [Acinetobacter baumannii]|uniref:AIPR family protein n=3 Tax=Acinetobacter baumannii TaxID=470 RepID=UPI000DE63273|nr:AIPR family protein [Acinetobacter baumannii]MDC4936845.1 AIPR family protein [Acinetobacter baumannii]MDC5377328.1 AIPR family protein [Acinetobacter baumannii]MDV7584651.1 AIPR family protein [Acinetobacter baumannii]SSM83442.1 AIPR protein [Acinetobacter baumannii]SSM84636.1 AIPR protein [Acinetobacter baumannii]